MNKQNCNCSQRSALLNALRAEDFVLYEVVLYLDCHPHDTNALKYYNEHRALAKKLRNEYEKNYGPLTADANISCDKWDWIGAPWPWEKEAN